MATHNTVQSMLKESLVEMFLVAKYCINFRKDPNIWSSSGCYGYPAAILLFSIADSIGSYVIGGKVRKHFNILNNKDYYNLNLAKNVLDLIYEKYRCFLTHNAVMGVDVVLSIGIENGLIFEVVDRRPQINLLPFLKITESAVSKFLENTGFIVPNSKQLKKILNR